MNTLPIELEEETRKTLERLASQEGLSPEAYAAQILKREMEPVDPVEKRLRDLETRQRETNSKMEQVSSELRVLNQVVAGEMRENLGDFRVDFSVAIYALLATVGNMRDEDAKAWVNRNLVPLK